MPTIDCSQYPAQQLAIKACLESLLCTMDTNPVQTLQAQLAFASKAGAALGSKVDQHNACFLSALGYMFAADNKTLPPLPQMPSIPDIGSAIPSIPAIPTQPSTPGIAITYASDGVTPLTITF